MITLMRFASGLLLAGMLAACAPAAQAPKATASARPSASVEAAPTPTPSAVLDINYLDQSGSRFTVWLDITNYNSVPAVGKPLISLYWKEMSIGRLCGPTVSVAPGATTRVKFDRPNGPAALFDREDVALVPAC